VPVLVSLTVSGGGLGSSRTSRPDRRTDDRVFASSISIWEGTRPTAESTATPYDRPGTLAHLLSTLNTNFIKAYCGIADL
jgi:hypothetical protein